MSAGKGKGRQAGKGRPEPRDGIQLSEYDDPTFSEEDGIRYLHFGTPWVQGAMKIRSPHALVLEYARQMMAWLLFLEAPAEDDERCIGLLGLGAGSFARYCLKHMPSQVLAVEWNPRVTAACQAYMRLPLNDPRLRIVHADAGDWVQDIAHRGTCRALMVDLYNHEALGPVRDSVAFYRGCRQVVSRNASQAGIVTINLFGRHESFEVNLANISEAFDDRVLVLPEVDEGNRVAMAFAGPEIKVEPELLLARADEVERRYGLPARKWARTIIGG